MMRRQMGVIVTGVTSVAVRYATSQAIASPIKQFPSLASMNIIFPRHPLMRYEPKNEEVVIEGINTANKNIQSYFMRSDKSYYAKPEDSFPLYNTKYPFLRLIVDTNCVVLEVEGVERKRIENDCLIEMDYNTRKYSTKTRCCDEMYKILRQGVMDILERMNEIGTQSTGKNGANKEEPGKVHSSEMFVQLIFCDFFSRSILFSLLDILLKQIRFKAVILLPISLAVSFGLNCPNCSFIFKRGFSFIDDFVRVDAYAPGHSSSISVDDEDFVEDFTRLQLLGDNLRYSCEMCEQKEETEEKIQQHVEKEHNGGGYFYYDPSGNFEDEFKDRLRYLFGKDKAERVSKNIYVIGRDFEMAEPISDHYQLALRGADLFSKLECAKETWMTDKEWNEWRTRLLKEKVLFFI